MAKRKRPQRPARKRDNRLFELEVFLISGPVTEKFAKDNPVVSRTIAIRGGQTLSQLHDAIFDAFDRDDEHMYEFQVGGKKPMDPKARRYVLPMVADDAFDRPAGVVTGATVGSLGLKQGDAFAYWFDFGDDWWHQLNVKAIVEKAPPGSYPVVTERVGDSPPQYIDWDEEP